MVENKVLIIGRLTADVELKYTPSGIAVCEVSVAINPWVSQEDREAGNEKEADFIPVECWRQSAEFLSKMDKQKGALVSVEGRLKQRRWTDTQGKKHSKLVVIAEGVKSLEKRAGGGGYRPTDEDDPY